ncbi:MAG: aldo/keto reductase [Eggerthellaceae bacterium]|nr:aldo/keto reductase [Eggerthellaceae bacterium]
MKKLGFGLMRLPLLDKNDPSSVDIEAVKRMADSFMKNGFTYFDTAYPYHRGNSEVAFREAVAKRYPRGAYTITDKLSLFMVREEEELPDFFEGQLERLGVEYMDYYWLHGLNERTYRQAEEMHAFEFVRQKKAEGKIRHIGLSFHDRAAFLDEILTAHPEMEYVQIQLNYLDWDDPTIESRLCYEVAVKHRKPVIVMEPIKGGSLIQIPEEAKRLYKAARPELSVASWAVRFAASPSHVMMVLSGMGDEAQMEDNISYMKEFQPLSDEEKSIVAQAVEIIRKSAGIPCTACRYCTDTCPKGIAIPDYFALCNNLKRFGTAAALVTRVYLGNLAQAHGKPSDCVKCGKCEALCPQHLPIREYLQEAAEILE